MVSHHKNTVTKQVAFSNQGQDNEIQSDSPDLSTTEPDEWQMPYSINFVSSGLQCSTQCTVLGQQNKVFSHSTTSLKKLKRSSTKACLVLFSSFCTIGAGHIGFILIRCLHKILQDLHTPLIVFIDSTGCTMGPSIVSQCWHNPARHQMKRSIASVGRRVPVCHLLSQ